MTNIEDKAKYENETGQKLPDKILADCETCKKETVFEYFAIQEGYKIIPAAPLYNCTGGCRGTKAYPTLMNKFNGRAIE